MSAVEILARRTSTARADHRARNALQRAFFKTSAFAVIRGTPYLSRAAISVDTHICSGRILQPAGQAQTQMSKGRYDDKEAFIERMEPIIRRQIEIYRESPEGYIGSLPMRMNGYFSERSPSR